MVTLFLTFKAFVIALVCLLLLSGCIGVEPGFDRASLCRYQDNGYIVCLNDEPIDMHRTFFNEDHITAGTVDRKRKQVTLKHQDSLIPFLSFDYLAARDITKETGVVVLMDGAMVAEDSLSRLRIERSYMAQVSTSGPFDLGCRHYDFLMIVKTAD
ncbi:hypothetical protein [Taibaiella koreensis]|uniref:hypothetical protein n=1 Tax=Taibaiella koreensis TaxID=1268548 RepID=UPI000E5A0C03|nr:hypothetical protein [Taibaiella koreensis]